MTKQIRPTEYHSYAFSQALGPKFASELNECFIDIDLTKSNLWSPDWRRRIAAMEILYRFWKIGLSELGKLSELGLEDENEQVRAYAIRLVEAVATQALDHMKLLCLVRIALNESETDRERRAAYNGVLRTIEGRKIEWKKKSARLSIVIDSTPTLDLESVLENTIPKIQYLYLSRLLIALETI